MPPFTIPSAIPSFGDITLGGDGVMILRRSNLVTAEMPVARMLATEVDSRSTTFPVLDGDQEDASRALHWTAGEPLQRVTAPHPPTAHLFLEVSGASCTSARCMPPGIPAEDVTKHPAGQIKYLKYLRLKTLAC